MVRIAVTGGIGCGKSRLALYLQSRHIPVCEADELAHIALGCGSKVYVDIVAEFGIGVLDASSEIDRSKLADMVFGDAKRLEKLNGLVHPSVKKEITNWLESEEESGARIAVVIIPLLFEVGMSSGWDAIISVGCSGDMQQKRLMGRGLSSNQCRQRVLAQMPVEEKMKQSDFAIWNDEDEASFEKKIKDVFKMILERQYGGSE